MKEGLLTFMKGLGNGCKEGLMGGAKGCIIEWKTRREKEELQEHREPAPPKKDIIYLYL